MRIENYTAQELFDRLNEVDEDVAVEAKALSRDSSRTIMETVCSFSNEPGLGGGVILLGVAENDPGCTPKYRVEETGHAFLQNESRSGQTLQGAALAMQDKDAALQGKDEYLQDKLATLQSDPAIVELLKRRKKRMTKKDLSDLIVDLCKGRSLKSSELSALLGKNETYLRTVLASLVSTAERLRYTIPEMVTHPDQAYTAS